MCMRTRILHTADGFTATSTPSSGTARTKTQYGVPYNDMTHD